MAEFEHIAPQSIKEAIALISEYQGNARVIAGGTDLLAMMKKGLEMPKVLINIECIPELNYINYNLTEGMQIGAATPLSALEKSVLIKSKFPVLAQAVGSMASPIIRNRATIGGNICNAAPSADTVPALIVLRAKLIIAAIGGEKVIPIEEFFTGPGQTVIQPGQIVKEISVPEMPAGSSAAYLKHKRRKGADLAVVGVAAMVTLDSDFRSSGGQSKIDDIIIKDIRVALGASRLLPSGRKGRGCSSRQEGE